MEKMSPNPLFGRIEKYDSGRPTRLLVKPIDGTEHRPAFQPRPGLMAQ